MKLLLDINVVLDALLGRAPWAAEAALLLSRVEAGHAEAYVAGHTITTIHYLLAKQLGVKKAATALSDLLRIVSVVPLADADFQQALVPGIDDFEDAVQAAAALQVGASFIVTRNQKDFEGVTVAVRSAGEVVALL